MNYQHIVFLSRPKLRFKVCSSFKVRRNGYTICQVIGKQVAMAIDRQYVEQGWLDASMHRLDLLYKESREYQDEGDTLSTELRVKSAKELMSQVAKSSRPQIAISVNGEIVLSWNKAGSTFRACIATDGTITFYKDHTRMDRLMFVRQRKHFSD